MFGQIIPTPDELLNKAFELNKEGKYEESIIELNKILGIDPDNISALHTRANAQIGLEKFDEAIEDFERIFVLEQEPSRGILYNYAVALSGNKEYEKAILYFDLIDEKHPNYINALNRKGIALLELSRFDEAIENFDLVLKDKPDNFTAHLYRGISLSNLKDYDEAFKSIYRALSIDPQNERAKQAEQSTLKQKGLSLLYDESNPEEAIIYFKKALANNPQDTDASAYLARAELEVTGKQLDYIFTSVVFTWFLSGFGIALTVYFYYRPRKQKQ